MEHSELMVELGVEEIPASMLESAANQLAKGLVQDLQEQRLPASVTAIWYTPRRIVVGLDGIPARQEDLFETITGPPKSVAYDAEGSPTKAAHAFAQKHGVALSQIKILRNPKGEYLSLVRRVRGEKTRVILERLLPSVIAKIQFPKTMHWSPDMFRFGRPLRWLVAFYAGNSLRFQVADVASSRYTSGHRFLGKPRIRVSSLATLQEGLRENGVLLDPAAREARIQSGLLIAAETAGGHLLEDVALLKTVVNLNEWPSIICGSFEGKYLALPKEILVTVMREHQKYFSVLSPSNELLPVFLAVVNLSAENMDKIRAGHERVLSARLADASFFWETDRKVKLLERESALRSVLFQEKLGSYYDKTRRMMALLPLLTKAVFRTDLDQDLELAVRISKCDLLTDMVREFTDLQGIVGALYARAEGYPANVWQAVYDQYLPKSTSSSSPSTPAGALLALVDRLDTVCGCFSVGLVPSGSRDPFAVRRQGNGILKILIDQKFRVSLEALIRWSLAAHHRASESTAEELKRFFEGRFRFLLEELGFSYDCINAALASGFDDPVDALERVRALQAMRAEVDFLSLASNFKRIINILAQSEFTRADPDPAKMTDAAEITLWRSFLSVRGPVESARARQDYGAALSALASLRKVVDEFFEQVLVMAEDEEIRVNRLRLLDRLAHDFLGIADISQIVIDR